MAKELNKHVHACPLITFLDPLITKFPIAPCPTFSAGTEFFPVQCAKSKGQFSKNLILYTPQSFAEN